MTSPHMHVISFVCYGRLLCSLCWSAASCIYVPPLQWCTVLVEYVRWAFVATTSMSPSFASAVPYVPPSIYSTVLSTLAIAGHRRTRQKSLF